MTIIQLPDGQNAEFPESMSQDDIKSVLQKKFPPQNQENNKAQQFGQLIGANRTPLDTLRDLASGVVSGLGKGGQSIASAATGGYAPTVNMNEISSPLSSPNKSIGGEITKGIGEYLPYGMGGGASLLGQVAAGAGYGAATAEPNEQNLFGLLPSGKTGSAIKNALLNAILHGGFQLFNSMRPSQLLRGNLSPAELGQNVEAAAQTPTSLGDVIGSPFLKRQYENVLSKLPFSGATERMQQAGQQTVNQGENILNNFLGNENPANVTDEIHSALMNQFAQHQATKNSLYTNANKIADKANLKLELPNFSKKAEQYSDAIDATNMLKFEPDMAKIFNKLKNYQNPVVETQNIGKIVNQSGQPIINETKTKYPSLEEANLLKGKLNHYAQTAAKSPDPAQRNMARVFGDLGSTLKKDILTTIKQSGNKKLQQAYQGAEENYAKNFSPFLDRDIYKFISGKADPDTIVPSFLKTSKGADRDKVLSKLTNKLTDKERSLLGYSYFSRALDNEGNLNPAKLSTLINNLGRNQFNTLVPDQVMRNNLRNYRRLYSMNTSGVNIMQNPATGQKNLDVIPALLAHGGTSMIGGALGGLPGALAGLVLPGVVSRPLVNALTSPAIRESLVNAMIRNRPLNRNAISKIQALSQGLKQIGNTETQ